MGESGSNDGDLRKTFEWFEPSVVLKDVKEFSVGIFKFKVTKADSSKKCTAHYASMPIRIPQLPTGTSNLSTHLKYHHPEKYSLVAKK